jgi:hypothetical protein
MQKPTLRSASLLGFLLLVLGLQTGFAQKWSTLENTHFRVIYQKPYAQLAGEVLRIAESVWPTLAKAYESYDRYQRIDILITDDGDDANGFAIYNSSRIAVFAPHMDWVMRNRQNWLGNVVTHELAHVFTLRRAAWLSAFDAVDVYGATYDYGSRVNYAFHLPWIPLVAPTWYVEGIAQFEAAQNGNDTWDSQRDMVLRDAYLTGTLPTLDFIETFDYDADWTQAERTYNTGFGFLLYLKDRFGVDKVRALAKPKPIFNFSFSARQAFGESLPQLFEEFRRSLANRYADYKGIPKDPIADPDMVGSYQQDLAFSPDGRYMAWLGNDEDRKYPLNWIYWKEIGATVASKTKKPEVAPAGPSTPAPAPKKESMLREPDPFSVPGAANPMAGRFLFKPANPVLGLAQKYLPSVSRHSSAPGLKDLGTRRVIEEDVTRSDELGSSGLEFSPDNKRLLTTRGSENSAYTDIWEYEFKSKGSESDKWHRLTWEERASYPSYHPSKKLIVFTRKFGGTTNIAVLDSTGKTYKLTNFTNGEQVYNPRYTPSGDSIYFTFAWIDKEAIAAISADAQGFDTFGSLKDSALYPDSLTLAKGQKFTFVTPLKRGGIRNVRFCGDTLLWSSNTEDSVYNVYARLPKDSSVYRATRVAGQALEPITRGGTLYYQGYQKQRFQIFKQPLALAKTSLTFGRPTDSLVTVKPKKEDFTKVFETGDFGGVKTALDITPYVALQPQFIAGNNSYTDLAVGLSVTLGEGYGTWLQGFSGAVSKRWDFDTPPSYQFSYSGFIAEQPIAHTSLTWPVNLYYSYYHDIVNYKASGLQGLAGTPDNYEAVSAHIQELYTRDIFDALIPLPYQFTVSGQFWRETITDEFRFQIDTVRTGQPRITHLSPRLSFLRDDPDHTHYNMGLNWWWGKGMIGTYMPTGIAVGLDVHKWWATYDTSTFFLDSASAIQYTIDTHKPVPLAVLQQDAFDPWSVGASFSSMYSYRTLFSVFAGGELGAYLNTFPTESRIANLNDADPANPDTTFRDVTAHGLWPMTYKIGYYRLSGYPYQFMYRGRDIMEGSSYAFGQAGLSVPLRIGAFLDGLPTTSFKSFMLTVMGEAGTTLLVAPDKIVTALDKERFYPLLDYGVRLSANFRLYHELPFTLFGQVFMPVNDLKASDLLNNDYPSSLPLSGESVQEADLRDRKDYLKVVKEPRFFVGFELGIF